MISKTFIILLLIVAVCVTSCDPGIAVVLANRSRRDQEIKVIYPPNFRFPGDAPHVSGIRDSIKTFNLAVKNDAYPLAVALRFWDTTARTYTFTLPANRSALVESQFFAAAPTFGQVLIINRNDTVQLKRHGKDFKKRPKLVLGGTWTHTITEKNE